MFSMTWRWCIVYSVAVLISTCSGRVAEGSKASQTLQGHACHEMIVYDALYDPLQKAISIWMQVSSVTAEIDFSCETHVAGQVETATPTLQKLSRHSEDAWLSYLMKCEAASLPEKVVIQPVGRTIMVKEMQTDKQGRLAVCLGVVYSQQPFLQDWLRYYSELGVDHFEVYRARDHDLRSNPVSGGVTIFEPFEEVSHTNASYHDVPPGEHRWQFGQATVHDLCIHKLRYIYDYIALVDGDEYINLNNSGNSLVEFLDENLPATVASARFYNWVFPACIQTYSRSMPVLQQFNMAAAEPELGTSKSIVRPLGVASFYVHSVLEPAPGFEAERIISPDNAVVKHFRNMC